MIRCALLRGSLSIDPASVLDSQEAGLLGPRAVPKRRDDFLRGRFIAKTLLQRHFPGTGLRDHVILPDERGVPTVPSPVSVSITHTREYAAAALVELPWRVGIDAERFLDNPELITGNYFTESEQALVRAAPDRRVATTIWAAKEAVTKASGEGLRVTMTSIEVSAIGAAGGDGWREVHLTCAQGSLPAWAWDEPDCVVCVVVSAPGAGRPAWERAG